MSQRSVSEPSRSRGQRGPMPLPPRRKSTVADLLSRLTTPTVSSRSKSRNPSGNAPSPQRSTASSVRSVSSSAATVRSTPRSTSTSFLSRLQFGANHPQQRPRPVISRPILAGDSERLYMHRLRTRPGPSNTPATTNSGTSPSVAQGSNANGTPATAAASPAPAASPARTAQGLGIRSPVPSESSIVATPEMGSESINGTNDNRPSGSGRKSDMDTGSPRKGASMSPNVLLQSGNRQITGKRKPGMKPIGVLPGGAAPSQREQRQASNTSNTETEGSNTSQDSLETTRTSPDSDRDADASPPSHKSLNAASPLQGRGAKLQRQLSDAVAVTPARRGSMGPELYHEDANAQRRRAARARAPPSGRSSALGRTSTLGTTMAAGSASRPSSRAGSRANSRAGSRAGSRVGLRTNPGRTTPGRAPGTTTPNRQRTQASTTPTNSCGSRVRDLKLKVAELEWSIQRERAARSAAEKSASSGEQAAARVAELEVELESARRAASGVRTGLGQDPDAAAGIAGSSRISLESSASVRQLATTALMSELEQERDHMASLLDEQKRALYASREATESSHRDVARLKRELEIAEHRHAQSAALWKQDQLQLERYHDEVDAARVQKSSLERQVKGLEMSQRSLERQLHLAQRDGRREKRMIATLETQVNDLQVSLEEKNLENDELSGTIERLMRAAEYYRKNRPYASPSASP